MEVVTQEPKPKKVYRKCTRKPCEWVARDGHTCPRVCQKSYILPGHAEPKYLCCYHHPSFLKKQNDILLKKYYERTAPAKLAAREAIVLVESAS